ncbi:MAG: hypothetical protein ACRD3G_16120 [Vicinamibacterales bacterium]
MHIPSPRSLLLVAIATLIATVTGPPARAGADPPQDVLQAREGAGRDPGPDEEGHTVEPSGLAVGWALPPSPRVAARLETPWLTLVLRNLDAAIYDVQVRTLEDAGTMQSRRVSDPVETTVVERGEHRLALVFATVLPAQLTHSGMVVAVLRACPRNGGACLTGTSPPLFFHLDGGEYLVYDEELLCRSYNCGALEERVRPEQGTWRVMGGGPLVDVPSREEPDEGDDDDVVVDGGDL